MHNLVKLYKSEDISSEDNEKLEELLVFSVLAHDKHQDNLKKATEEELAENKAAFAKLMEEQEREDKPILTAFKDTSQIRRNDKQRGKYLITKYEIG